MTVTRIFDILNHQCQHYPQQDALAYKNGGSWQKISIESLIQSIEVVSYGLLKYGIKTGDKVAIVSSNRPEWIILDYAVQQIGAVTVPIYSTITEEDYRFILEHAEVKLIFVEDKNLYQKVNKAVADLSAVYKIFTFDQFDGIPYWKEILNTDLNPNQTALSKLREKLTEDNLVTIIYTSGTTGTPKGVMLSHKNILSNALAVASIFPLEGSKSRTLSFLPLCHIFERTALVMAIYLGVSIYFAESLETIGANLKEVKPHYFSAVPRLLEKTYERIIAKGQTLNGISRRLFDWSLALGKSYQLPRITNLGFRLQLFFARRLVFTKWKEAMGGKLLFVVCGAAALNSEICRMFWAADIPVLEAYGLTEASPGVTFTRLNYQSARIGYSGMALDGVKVRLAEDGEILVKGPNVMLGYHRRPDLTETTVAKNGWLQTGDIGELDDHNRLRITDRKKEMFKTSGGKYIAPQILENHFKTSIYIDQIMVVGEGRKFPAALVVPVFSQLQEWAASQGTNHLDPEDLLSHPKVIELFSNIFDRYNQKFAQYEKLKKFALLPTPWTIERGELTPTLKLKRSTIFNNNRHLIDSLYN